MKSSLCTRLLILFALMPALLSCASRPDGRAGTRADRLALFDYVVEKTMERTAWNPCTAGQPELHFRAEAGKLPEVFGSADGTSGTHPAQRGDPRRQCGAGGRAAAAHADQLPRLLFDAPGTIPLLAQQVIRYRPAVWIRPWPLSTDSSNRVSPMFTM